MILRFLFKIRNSEKLKNIEKLLSLWLPEEKQLWKHEKNTVQNLNRRSMFSKSLRILYISSGFAFNLILARIDLRDECTWRYKICIIYLEHWKILPLFTSLSCTEIFFKFVFLCLYTCACICVTWEWVSLYKDSAERERLVFWDPYKFMRSWKQTNIATFLHWIIIIWKPSRYKWNKETCG